MTDKMILIGIPGEIEDIVREGKIIVDKILAKCEVNEYYQIIHIEGKVPKFWAVIDYNECINKMIAAGELIHMSTEDYEEILAKNIDSVSDVEFDEKDAPSCILV